MWIRWTNIYYICRSFSSNHYVFVRGVPCKNVYCLFYSVLDKDHSLIKAFLKKKGRRLGVIIEVLETAEDTVIEFTSKFGGEAGLAAEVNWDSF